MEHRRQRARRRVTMPLVAVMAVAAVGGTPSRAHAASRFDHHSTGNGRHNRISITVNSPTFNHGIQNVSNTNVDGNTVTQASFCKGRFRHCRLAQRSGARSHW
jgi:hypothetical protein